MLKYIISGVGRSGTTALYDMLSNALIEKNPDLSLCYEPFLWGPDTWDMTTREQSSKAIFQNTSSIYPLGLWAHTSSALFAEMASPPVVSLLDNLSRQGGLVLAKFIRASGRLEAILDWDPTVKIVHICRNPLQVVNSALQLFSFYGEEFHSNDWPRFTMEVENRWGEFPDLDSEDAAVRQAQWWYYMNKAAFEVAERYPSSVTLVSQEALAADNPGTVNRILERWGLGGAEPTTARKEGFGGTVGGKVVLSKAQVDKLHPYFEQYDTEFLHRTCTDDLHAWAHQKDSVVEHFRENAPDKYVERFPGIDPESGPINTRVQFLKERNEHRRAMEDAYLKHRKVMLSQTKALTQRLYEFDRDLQVVMNLGRDMGRSRLLKLLGPVSKRLRINADQITQASGKLGRPVADVTCVVTCYNNKVTIHDAVLSVIAQTQQIREIIIADDCSTDGSHEIINKIAVAHDNVRIVRRHHNIGPGLNRHLAFLDANSTYITQLDGDDMIAPDKIEREWAVLQDNPDRIAYSDYVIDSPSRSVNADTSWFVNMKSDKERVEAVLFRTSWLPHNMLYSKSLYVKAGGYDTSAGMYEDWSLKLRLAEVCDDWFHTAGTGLVYNKHTSGLSSSPQAIHDFWILYCLAKNYLLLLRNVGANRILEYISTRIERASWYVGRAQLVATLEQYKSTDDLADRLFALLSSSLDCKVPEELHEVKGFMDRLEEHARKS